jgi:hypothetical protein
MSCGDQVLHHRRDQDVCGRSVTAIIPVAVPRNVELRAGGDPGGEAVGEIHHGQPGGGGEIGHPSRRKPRVEPLRLEGEAPQPRVPFPGIDLLLRRHEDHERRHAVAGAPGVQIGYPSTTVIRVSPELSLKSLPMKKASSTASGCTTSPSRRSNLTSCGVP